MTDKAEEMSESELSGELYMKTPNAKSVGAFIEGLQILAKYMPNGFAQKYAFGGEHDVIHVWGDVNLEKLPEGSQDGRRLLELGFHTDDDLDQWQYFT